jgi:hypothetical protein
VKTFYEVLRHVGILLLTKLIKKLQDFAKFYAVFARKEEFLCGIMLENNNKTP